MRDRVAPAEFSTPSRPPRGAAATLLDTTAATGAAATLLDTTAGTAGGYGPDRQAETSMESWQAAAHYHQQTKHAFGRYARSTGFMDWANQPDPFRRFPGAPLIRLPLLSNEAESPTYDDLFVPGAIPPQPIRLESIAGFLQYSLALSAWKALGGSRWALRINPSSGNLHPTEGYLVAGPTPGLHDAAAVYHYAPKEHGLERRTDIATETWTALRQGFPPQTFFAGLSSVHWREAWKYGERAYRYCQHDVGHALAALVLSAAMLGWRTRLLTGMSDAEVAALLGLDRPTEDREVEREHPDLLLAVIAMDTLPDALPPRLAETAVADVANGAWNGQPNRLSTDHMAWDIIEATAQACVKPPRPTELTSSAWPAVGEPRAPRRGVLAARRIIFQRRSAVDMDGETGMSAEAFYLMMDRVMPRADVPPFGTFGLPVCVHLALFVHLVEGLSPGLYFLLRTPDRLDELRAGTHPDFAWRTPAGCPESLPLYLLVEGDARRASQQVSCGQWIASRGAFSLGMIAEFDGPLRRHGGWFYRRLFWETGVIGQVLYLEAEAAGLRATGIGCFFDDPVHDLLGLRGTAFQSLYHFTVGGAVDDERLTSSPPYPR